jgi:hypothetical protein
MPIGKIRLVINNWRSRDDINGFGSRRQGIGMGKAYDLKIILMVSSGRFLGWFGNLAAFIQFLYDF